MSVLFIGPFPPPTGGIAYQHKLLFDYFSAHSILESRSFNSCKLKRPYPIKKILFNYLTLFYRILSSDLIILTCSSRAVPTFGLFICVLSSLLFKQCVIRKGGGVNPFKDYSPFLNLLSLFTLRFCDLFTVQTKALYDSTSSLSTKILLSSNIRDVDKMLVDYSRVFSPDRVCTKFVFVGHVKKSKGLESILKLDSHLPPGISIDVYGPCHFDIPQNCFDFTSFVTYKGELPQKSILELLSSSYDCLLLPTHHIGEGIPGVLVEAFQLGVPVITTNWKSLPELVTADVGLLIESPATVENLLQAILEIHYNPSKFLSMRVSCLQKGNTYRPVNALNEFLLTIEKLHS